MTAAYDASGSASSGAALIYTRVSSPGQVEGTSLDSQESACRAYAAAHGYTVALALREISTTRAELWDRPLLSLARTGIRQGAYTALIVYALDRLARDPIQQGLLIMECQRAGVALDIVLEPLDSSPEGMLIAYVRGYAAQLEREKIRERQMRARRQIAQAGGLTNAGYDLYGYRRDKAARVRVIYEPEAQVVRQMYQWCAAEHLSIMGIVRRLEAQGVPPPSHGKVVYGPDSRQRGAQAANRPPQWGTTQVQRILNNPAYKGESIAQRHKSVLAPPAPGRRTQFTTVERPPEEWIHLPAHVTPPLVSAETWQAAQDARRQRLARVDTRNAERPFLLRGLAYCANCGYALSPETHRHRQHPTWSAHRVYRCSSRLHTLTGACGGSAIPAEALDAWVWEQIESLLHDPEQIAREMEAQQRAAAYELHDLSALSAAGADGPMSAPTNGQVSAPTAARARQEAQRLTRKQSDLLARWTAVDDETALPWAVVEAQIARMEREKRQWQARADEAEAREAARQATAQRITDIRTACAAVLGRVGQATFAQQRAVIEQLGVRVAGNGRAWLLQGAIPVIGGAVNATASATASVADDATESAERSAVPLLAFQRTSTPD